MSWPVPPVNGRLFSSTVARRRAVLALKKRMNAEVRRASQAAIQASLEQSRLESQQLTKIASVLRILEQRSAL